MLRFGVDQDSDATWSMIKGLEGGGSGRMREGSRPYESTGFQDVNSGVNCESEMSLVHVIRACLLNERSGCSSLLSPAAPNDAVTDTVDLVRTVSRHRNFLRIAVCSNSQVSRRSLAPSPPPPSLRFGSLMGGAGKTNLGSSVMFALHCHNILHLSIQDITSSSTSRHIQ